MNRLRETLKRFSGFYKKSINASTLKSTITSHIQDVAFDFTTSNSIQDGGAIVVNILVIDLRVQLQHCTYQIKTLLFALIKILGYSSPLSSKNLTTMKFEGIGIFMSNITVIILNKFGKRARAYCVQAYF